jgi:hypothetical protein
VRLEAVTTHLDERAIDVAPKEPDSAEQLPLRCPHEAVVEVPGYNARDDDVIGEGSCEIVVVNACDLQLQPFGDELVTTLAEELTGQRQMVRQRRPRP